MPALSSLLGGGSIPPLNLNASSQSAPAYSGASNGSPSGAWNQNILSPGALNLGSSGTIFFLIVAFIGIMIFLRDA
jgi:hypothetical protein